MRAPAGQRGGWISAHKRRLLQANTTVTDETLDASNIARRLWVGGKPPFDRHLPEFDVLVLCARELQPSVVSFRGTVYRCPLPDAEISGREIRIALVAGRHVADALTRGRRVLVTCAQGINRSALVASLGLGLVTYLSAEQLITNVRSKRHHQCLGNAHFRQILHRYIGPGRRPPAAPRGDRAASSR
jgi:hypothetical protein